MNFFVRESFKINFSKLTLSNKLPLEFMFSRCEIWYINLFVNQKALIRILSDLEIPPTYTHKFLTFNILIKISDTKILFVYQKSGFRSRQLL